MNYLRSTRYTPLTAAMTPVINAPPANAMSSGLFDVTQRIWNLSKHQLWCVDHHDVLMSVDPAPDVDPTIRLGSRFPNTPPNAYTYWGENYENSIVIELTYAIHQHKLQSFIQQYATCFPRPDDTPMREALIQKAKLLALDPNRVTHNLSVSVVLKLDIAQVLASPNGLFETHSKLLFLQRPPNVQLEPAMNPVGPLATFSINRGLLDAHDRNHYNGQQGSNIGAPPTFTASKPSMAWIITIIDNEQRSADRYINIGTHTMRVVPVVDRARMSGVYMTSTREDGLLDPDTQELAVELTYLPLEELGPARGFYTSYHEAVSARTFDKAVFEQELLDHKRIVSENQLERTRLEHEAAAAKIEREREREQRTDAKEASFWHRLMEGSASVADILKIVAGLLAAGLTVYKLVAPLLTKSA